MKLADKGPIKNAPRLKGLAQPTSLEIQSWKGIISATHWTIGDSTKINGADFYVGEEELGHIHLDGEIHLALIKSLAKLLIDAKLASRFPWGDGWVQHSITDEKSADLGIFLFRLGYDRLNGLDIEKLKLKIMKRKDQDKPHTTKQNPLPQNTSQQRIRGL